MDVFISTYEPLDFFNYLGRYTIIMETELNSFSVFISSYSDDTPEWKQSLILFQSLAVTWMTRRRRRDA